MALRPLTPVQVRVLGCLLEKERTTPDTYPLTMNGLLAACNQSSNRNPVVSLPEHTVANALENLRAENLVRVVYSRSNRAERFRQVLDETLDLGAAELAVLCLLMVRGPQTTSELRARSERLHPFSGTAEVEQILKRLADRPEPLAARLRPGPGQKESRWDQLLGGALPDDAVAPAGEARPAPLAERVGVLEARVDALSDALTGLLADLGQAPPDRPQPDPPGASDPQAGR